ncbi:MAG: hypothetical protein COW28_04760 [bacterium (Candidatus Ratteibacteria) CG15_BIG_FIL_POST_REV_8_21_14_020_41_12]|uniref:Uncharacterized protein n=1 Tax=bacterium (Candidatus Ratteibacteria) CG15_BIG_FIL_POST_REV_8_21_14_020_41_12 TaxID=2014291 RepID=A0A2M7GY36_9BACT|nr:MAG: hypothetical protein COW28_04760 [bacterium (Candidatus Ratteibacteria) CG15_BIG_FIL_POST_REV_8_21_14_020_41_12]
MYIYETQIIKTLDLKAVLNDWAKNGWRAISCLFMPNPSSVLVLLETEVLVFDNIPVPKPKVPVKNKRPGRKPGSKNKAKK